MTRKKIILHKLFLTLLAGSILVGLMLATDPNKIALPFLILPFLLVGFMFYQIVATATLLKRSHANKHWTRVVPLSVAFLGVCLLLLESLHQLTWKDSFLAAGFTVLLWMYMGRADFLQK